MRGYGRSIVFSGEDLWVWDACTVMQTWEKKTDTNCIIFWHHKNFTTWAAAVNREAGGMADGKICVSEASRRPTATESSWLKWTNYIVSYSACVDKNYIDSLWQDRWRTAPRILDLYISPHTSKRTRPPPEHQSIPFRMLAKRSTHAHPVSTNPISR